MHIPIAAAKVPAPHAVHVVDRPMAHCPATHAVQDVAPALAPVAKRAGHAVHVLASTAPTAVLYRPAAQPVHEVAPIAADEYWPAGHGVHDEAELEAAVNVPLGHEVHTAPLRYWPAGHVVLR